MNTCLWFFWNSLLISERSRARPLVINNSLPLSNGDTMRRVILQSPEACNPEWWPAICKDSGLRLYGLFSIFIPLMMFHFMIVGDIRPVRDAMKYVWYFGDDPVCFIFFCRLTTLHFWYFFLLLVSFEWTITVNAEATNEL